MSLEPGARLDAYEIVRPLGSGGMGEVWLATEVRLGRKVALKLLPADLTREPSRILRFEQEARAASALSHPNVCTIHALGETADGLRYIAMEYVEGETLRSRLAATRLSIRAALDIAIQVAAALSAAHASGIVHRDIKPENVMLRPDGFVKVLDFGLAKLAPSGADMAGADSTRLALKTEAGVVVGTAAYMSPEQARGQEVDARTDIWSLGVLLYEMVAGRSPFAASSGTEVLAAILDREPAPVARFEPEAPQELQRLVTKALRKDRSQRYQTVQDLLLDLQALRDDLHAHAHSGSAPITAIITDSAAGGSGPTAAAVPRTRRRVVLAAAATVLLLGAVLGERAWRTARPAPTPAATTGGAVQRDLTRLTFGPGLQTDVTWAPDGTRFAYAAERNGNFEIWTQSVGGGDPLQVTKSPAPDTQPAWSPDGRRIVFRSERDGGGLFVVPALGGPERQLSSFGVHPQWSPDGAAIIFGDGVAPFLTNVFRVSPEGGEPPREILKDFVRGGMWYWIAPHPDGRVSVMGHHRQRGLGFFTVSPGDGQVTTSTIAPEFPLRVEHQGTRVRRFQWNAAGDALFAEAIVNEVQSLWRIGVEPRTLAWLSAERVTTGMGTDVAAALSPDGARLLFTTQREAVRLWVFPFDPVAGRVTGEGRPVSPEEGEATHADLAPDGRAVAYGLRLAGSDRADLWVTHFDSGTSELLAQNALVPRWSTDGKMIAYILKNPDRPPPGEWALAIRELGGAERLLSPWSSESLLMPSDWTADGRAILGTHISPLYTGMARLALWRTDHAAATASGRVLVEDARARLYQARYSPDGRWISFIVQPTDGSRTQLAVVPAAGGARADWIHIAREHEWPDKSRWSPDGRTIYFLSRLRSSFINLWGSRFDTERGTPVGEPFRITHFDAPGLVISPNLADGSEIGISAHRALLTMATVTGNIWMLDNVDK
jgi:Tol biopolymer transport system component